MDNSLKQRIIGAIVLIALASIFLPSILKEKVSNGVFESKIPEQPKVLSEYKMETHKIDELIKSESIKANEIKDKAIRVKESIQNEIETNEDQSDYIKPKPITKNNTPNTKENVSLGKKGAWILQIASFTNQDNANRMVTQLKSKGYKAYLNRNELNNKFVYRVFVGPFVKKESAINQQSQLNVEVKLNILLKAFNPIHQ